MFFGSKSEQTPKDTVRDSYATEHQSTVMPQGESTSNFGAETSELLTQIAGLLRENNEKITKLVELAQHYYADESVRKDHAMPNETSEFVSKQSADEVDFKQDSGILGMADNFSEHAPVSYVDTAAIKQRAQRLLGK